MEIIVNDKIFFVLLLTIYTKLGEFLGDWRKERIEWKRRLGF